MKILITGGSGFLGRGLLSRLYEQHELTVYSRDEFKQFLCKKRWPSVRYVLGDVQNYNRLVNVLPGHDLVIHTAAVKFIPEAENNVLETISVNVHGSETLFSACAEAHVNNVVAISTDKVCQPVNVYGMTKALMERMVGEFARYDNGTKYTACRYGNVVGSTGSVIPVFIEQAKQTGCVKITDPDMTRYWISIDEAVDLIMSALAAQNGDIVIPQPSSMTMRQLAGMFSEHVDVIGIRPGEKKHESLLHEQESVRAEYGGSNYILHSNGVYSEPFVLSSDRAKTLSSERMREMITESMLV